MPRRSRDVPQEYTEHEQALAQAVGARIRQRRKQLKLTQDIVRVRMEVENVHVSQGQFSRIEHGESLLTVAEVVALAKALEMSYEWLLEGIEACRR